MGFLSDMIGAGCDMVADATSPFREVANNMVVKPAKTRTDRCSERTR